MILFFFNAADLKLTGPDGDGEAALAFEFSKLGHTVTLLLSFVLGFYSRVARKVLDLVSEGPWSTRTEIEETLTSEGWETQALMLETSQVGPKALKRTVGKALTLLSKRGLLSEGTGQAFAPTRQGRIASDIQSLV